MHLSRTTAASILGMALATLAALALPQAARAQSLTLGNGDVVTINGNGTAGHIGATVYTPPNAMTTITASAPYAVQANGTSTFTLGTGGILNASGQYGLGLYALGSGQIMITGGALSAGRDGVGLEDRASGPVTVTGGVLSAGLNGYGLAAEGTGPVTVSGGTFTVSGGTLSAGLPGYGLAASGSGQVTIIGGTFTAGPGGFGLSAGGRATIDLFGTGFSYTVNGVTTPITSGTLPTDTLAGVQGTLSGTLLNNTGVTTTTFLNFGTIEVNVGTAPAAPEPSGVAAFAVAYLGLAALMFRARRRSVTASA